MSADGRDPSVVEQRHPVCELHGRGPMRNHQRGGRTQHPAQRALDQALRAALVKFYPKLKCVQLSDYKVRILDSATGTGARTRVLIESTDGKEEWGTVGVHDNIIEASLQALSDSLEYRLMKK